MSRKALEDDDRQPGNAELVEQRSFPSSLSQLEQQQQQQLPFEVDRSAIENFLRPDPSELPDDVELSPGEFFFTTFKVAGYSGLLLAAPTVLYEVIAYVVPGLTKSERKFLAPIVFGSSILFYVGLVFSYEILTPAALNFFVSYAEGAVESLWSIDQYFQFVLVLMLSTGLSFQVPVIQVLLGQLGIVNSQQMFSLWRYVVVGSTVAAAVLTPSTDPFTQALLAIPLVGLYMGGATVVKFIENSKTETAGAKA
eukprot:gene9542-9706_t